MEMLRNRGAGVFLCLCVAKASVHPLTYIETIYALRILEREMKSLQLSHYPMRPSMRLIFPN